MSFQEYNSGLFDFLQSAVTPFHGVHYLDKILSQAGFQELQEHENWQLQSGNGYFCIRDNGSLLAWKMSANTTTSTGWKILGCHTDSPALQVKPQPLKSQNSYTQLGVEVYGGPILATWFDRDLGIAGRVALRDQGDTPLMKLIDFKRPVAMIPNLAIHLNREVNEKNSIKRQKQLLPLLCQTADDGISFTKLLRHQLKKEHPDSNPKEILAFDLFCYDTQPPQLTGLHKEFIAGGRLDNLISCFVGIKSMIQKQNEGNCLLLCSNHEEIGSSSVAGAQGNFLSSVLARLLPDHTDRACALNKSLCISMDNAHALHPNFSEKYDPQHLPLLNHGPVIKYNANQRYATTSRSAAFFKNLCLDANVPVQEFVMQNDLSCGSTIGPVMASSFGIQTVDVGVPSLAMHSIRETTGTKDPYLLAQAIDLFLSRPL
ncbi:MAG: M18 family aminopeptidase [Desulfocapsa sp.]|nr:MAG: M18 family aminopeptidase [Desulfocapsa sp.]